MKLSIFYLDDEPACLGVFQAVFGDEYDVRVATTVTAARRMLSERAADVVITDQNMPEIKGTEFLREVAEKYPQSRRVLLTGSVAVINVIGDISSGHIDLFVPKPWTPVSMRRALERAENHFTE